MTRGVAIAVFLAAGSASAEPSILRISVGRARATLPSFDVEPETTAWLAALYGRVTVARSFALDFSLVGSILDQDKINGEADYSFAKSLTVGGLYERPLRCGYAVLAEIRLSPELGGADGSDPSGVTSAAFVLDPTISWSAANTVFARVGGRWQPHAFGVGAAAGALLYFGGAVAATSSVLRFDGDVSYRVTPRFAVAAETALLTDAHYQTTQNAYDLAVALGFSARMTTSSGSWSARARGSKTFVPRVFGEGDVGFSIMLDIDRRL